MKDSKTISWGIKKRVRDIPKGWKNIAQHEKTNCPSSQSFKNNILSFKKIIIIDKDIESLYALFGIWIMQTPL